MASGSTTPARSVSFKVPTTGSPSPARAGSGSGDPSLDNGGAQAFRAAAKTMTAIRRFLLVLGDMALPSSGDDNEKPVSYAEAAEQLGLIAQEDEMNAHRIAGGGGLLVLTRVVREGAPGVREKAAATLGSIAVADTSGKVARDAIAAGVVPALLSLCAPVCGDAVVLAGLQALHGLSMGPRGDTGSAENKTLLVEAGVLDRVVAALTTPARPDAVKSAALELCGELGFKHPANVAALLASGAVRAMLAVVNPRENRVGDALAGRMGAASLSGAAVSAPAVSTLEAALMALYRLCIGADVRAAATAGGVVEAAATRIRTANRAAAAAAARGGELTTAEESTLREQEAAALLLARLVTMAPAEEAASAPLAYERKQFKSAADIFNAPIEEKLVSELPSRSTRHGSIAAAGGARAPSVAAGRSASLAPGSRMAGAVAEPDLLKRLVDAGGIDAMAGVINTGSAAAQEAAVKILARVAESSYTAQHSIETSGVGPALLRLAVGVASSAREAVLPLPGSQDAALALLTTMASSKATVREQILSAPAEVLALVAIVRGQTQPVKRPATRDRAGMLLRRLVGGTDTGEAVRKQLAALAGVPTFDAIFPGPPEPGGSGSGK